MKTFTQWLTYHGFNVRITFHGFGEHVTADNRRVLGDWWRCELTYKSGRPIQILGSGYNSMLGSGFDFTPAGALSTLVAGIRGKVLITEEQDEKTIVRVLADFSEELS